MKKAGALPFGLSLLFFAVFAINVTRGAFGAGVFLSDVHEMLMLSAAVVCFVIGTLSRQAANSSGRENRTAK